MSNLSSNEPSVTHSYLEDVRGIKSEPRGVFTPEFTRQNIDKIKEMADKFAPKKWGYLGVLVNMAPILDAEVHRNYKYLCLSNKKY